MTEIETKILELRNLQRLTQNALNFLADCDVKGRDVFAVGEIVTWLQAMSKQVGAQLDSMATPETPIEPEVVTAS